MKTKLIAAKDAEKDRNCDANLKSHAHQVLFGDTILNNDKSVLPDVNKDVLHSEALDSLRFPLGTNNDDDMFNEIDDEVVDVSIGLDHRVKVRKMPCHCMITKDMHVTGVIKMNDLNLPQVREMKKKSH